MEDLVLRSQLSKLMDQIDNVRKNISTLEEFGMKNVVPHTESQPMNLFIEASDWKISSQSCKCLIIEDGSQVRCWHTTWSSKVWPHLSVSQDLEVVYDPQEKRCTKIKELKNEVSVLSDIQQEDLVRSECTDLILYSTARKDPMVFFHLLQMYINLFVGRESYLKENKMKYKINTKEDGYVELMVPFAGSSNKGKSVELGVVFWDIEMDSSSQFMKETYKAEFSVRGLKHATACNLPEMVIEKGYCETWSVTDCLERMCALSKCF